MPQATAARRTPAIGGSSGTDAGASGETAGADAAAAAGAEAVVVVIVFVPLASPHPNPLPQGERGPIGALLLPLSPYGRGRGPLRSSGRVRGEVLAPNHPLSSSPAAASRRVRTSRSWRRCADP